MIGKYFLVLQVLLSNGEVRDMELKHIPHESEAACEAYRTTLIRDWRGIREGSPLSIIRSECKPYV